MNFLKKKIREVRLKFKLSKCAFSKKHLQYFEHLILILVEAMHTLKEKVTSLSELSPMTKNRHILGLISHYRKFIENFSGIIRTLNELTKKKIPFVCSPLCQVSFDTIRIALTNCASLVISNPNQKHKLFDDACKHSW